MRRISFDASSLPHNSHPTNTLRYRKSSFSKEYATNHEPEYNYPLGRKRAPSMIHELSTHIVLPPKHPKDRFKLTVVFDLDETLIYARQGPLHARPYLKELLDFCGKNCETVVWTAGVRSYAQGVIRTIDPNGIIDHCVYRHEKWFNGEAGYIKDLALCDRPLDRIIIFENTPDCIRGFEEHGVLVSDYQGGQETDNTLPAVTKLLEDLVRSHLTVPEYLRRCPLLTRQYVPTDVGDTVYAYCLDPDKAVQQRINRDLSPMTPQQYSSTNVTLRSTSPTNSPTIRPMSPPQFRPPSPTNAPMYTRSVSPTQSSYRSNSPSSPYTSHFQTYSFPYRQP